MYRPDHYAIHEYLPKSEYTRLGSTNRAWRKMDERILIIDDCVRKVIGVPAYCNTYGLSKLPSFLPHHRTESGLRVVGCKYYSPDSMHSFGRASDTVSEFIAPVQMIRTFIQLALETDTFDGFGTIGIEVGVNWFHKDLRNQKPNFLDRFYLFKKSGVITQDDLNYYEKLFLK